MIPVILIAAAAVFILSMIGTRVAITLSHRLRFMDKPGSEAHKQQKMAVPYGGGLAMALALGAGMVFFDLVSDPTFPSATGETLKHGSLLPIYLGAAVLLVVGLIDDRKPLSAKMKLLAQLSVAAVVVPTAHLGINSLGHHPLLAMGLAWVWMVGVTNAFNLLDHADGLSASVAVVSTAVLLSGTIMAGDLQLSALWAMLIATLLGFLVWNLPPAKVYMGDAGSMPLGFLVAAGTLSVTFWPSAQGGSHLAVLAPVFITAIPLFDTAVVMCKRWAAGKPLMVGDRNHISHRLERLGFSPAMRLAVVVSLQIALACGALLLRLSGDPLVAAVVVGQAAAILFAVVMLETMREKNGQSSDKYVKSAAASAALEPAAPAAATPAPAAPADARGGHV
jgi:UDP-GlcNAc:undecaprenyl-phosphate GlcNAc-1-phosphate transferase